MAQEGDLLWTPSQDAIEACQLTHFIKTLEKRGAVFSNYAELWRWTVHNPEAFWVAVWDFYDVQASVPYQTVVDRKVMPGARWFDGARLNYAQHLLRHAAKNDEKIAIKAYSELRAPTCLSWRELTQQVRNVATYLRKLGVKPGDRVAGFMPNIPEAAIAMIATLSIGGVWSVASPEFGVRTVIDRFSQITPKVLFAADGYQFAGKPFSRVGSLESILDALPSIEAVIWVPYLDPDAELKCAAKVTEWPSIHIADVPTDQFSFEQVESMAPLWIVFSSGTTGPPKAIVHSHVGMLLEHLKATGLQWDFSSDSCMFLYTTTGWAVWNGLLSALLQGSSIVLYDGSPTHPGPERLWTLAAESGATCFGASPSFLKLMQTEGVVPSKICDLSQMRMLFLTGSPTTPDMFEWFYENVRRDLWLASGSGGTEICTAWVGAVPTLPVRAGEMQGTYLGLDVHAWDDERRDLIDEVGELVVTSPAPCMPIYFWNDTDGARYREAYFTKFPGVWTHGDRIKFNQCGGSYIYGRSDATLNRYGVRIGSAEIYNVLDRIPEIVDGLIVCLERPDGEFFMPLFVEIERSSALTPTLRDKINSLIRLECSPRHVPDEIIPVPSIPYTLTGKRMEIPVRKILSGVPAERAAGLDVMRNPQAIDWFSAFASTSHRLKKSPPPASQASSPTE